MYCVALTGGIAVGAALPLMTLVFGSSTASFNNQAGSQADADAFTGRINHLVLYFVYLFVARFVIGYIGTLCICIAATRTTRALRKAFLDSLLRQEVWHFDNESNGSPATQVTMSMSVSNDDVSPANRISQMAIVSIKALLKNCTQWSPAYRFSSRRTLWHLPFNGSSHSLL